jgi:hypothetical protein
VIAQCLANVEQFFPEGRDVRVAVQLLKLVQSDVDQAAKPQPFF